MEKRLNSLQCKIFNGKDGLSAVKIHLVLALSGSF